MNQWLLTIFCAITMIAGLLGKISVGDLLIASSVLMVLSVLIDIRNKLEGK